MSKNSIAISIITFCSFLLFCSVSRSQQQSQDSLLLEKIKNIEVSLNTVDENDENLFLNSVSFQNFYDDLSPDGDWIQISKEEIEKELKDGEAQSYSSVMNTDDELYFIWHPTSVGTDWRPYTNGRWMWTTDGWMWASNYRWGWAVFHYGRWWNSPKYGWVWMPGYVWAPAWVQWKVSENHVGWCPLTPNARWRSETGITTANYSYRNRNADWVFVDKSNFVNDLSNSNVLPASGNHQLISNSQTVLDIKSQNNRIFCNGPGVNDIEARTGKVMMQRQIRYSNQRGKAMIGNNDVSVYRENFKRIDNSQIGTANNGNQPKKYKRSPGVKKMKQNRGMEHRMNEHRMNKPHRP
jgi:hypothetical protein